MDPTYPAARLALIAADTRLGWVVGPADATAALGLDVSVLDPRDLDLSATSPASGDPDTGGCATVSGDDPAYVIHTSGSTGLALMRPDSFLINVGRGPVIDEHALYECLRDGVIAGAALDVLTAERVPGPLAELDNVVLTPHIGAMTSDAQRHVGRELIVRIGDALSDPRITRKS